MVCRRYGVSIAYLSDLPKSSFSGQGISVDVRRSGDDLLVMLVNEDNHRHLGVEIHGLTCCDGRELYELYGSDRLTIDQGGFTARLRPLESRIYCTNQKFESKRTSGRDYQSSN